MALEKLSSPRNLKNHLGVSGEYELAKNHTCVYFNTQTELDGMKAVKLTAEGTIRVESDYYAISIINPKLFELGTVSAPQVYTSDVGRIEPFVMFKPYKKECDISDLDYLVRISLHR